MHISTQDDLELQRPDRNAARTEEALKNPKQQENNTENHAHDNRKRNPSPTSRGAPRSTITRGRVAPAGANRCQHTKSLRRFVKYYYSLSDFIFISVDTILFHHFFDRWL